MAEDFEREIMNAVRDGLRKAVQDKLSGYNSPIDGLLSSIVTAHGGEIQKLLTTAITGCFADGEWRTNIATAVRHKLAQVLIQKFGGELEKQVNLLKSDPATRARITLAIEEIVNSAKT